MVNCHVCNCGFEMNSNSKFLIILDLTAPIDVYYEWIDKCQEANMLQEEK